MFRSEFKLELPPPRHDLPNLNSNWTRIPLSHVEIRILCFFELNSNSNCPRPPLPVARPPELELELPPPPLQGKQCHSSSNWTRTRTPPPVAVAEIVEFEFELETWSPAVWTRTKQFSSTGGNPKFEATVVVDLENSEEPMPIVTPTSAVSTTIYNSRPAEKFWSSWHGIHGVQLNFMAVMVFVAFMAFVAWRLRWSCGLFRADTLCPLMQRWRHRNSHQGMLCKSILI